MKPVHRNRCTLLAALLTLFVAAGPRLADAFALRSNESPSTGDQASASDLASPTFSQIAKKTNRPAGFPRLSAVCFSSRFKHPANASDPHDTFKAAADFHATAFYWINGPDKEWFLDIKRRGYPFQGWLSTILPDVLFGQTRQRGRILNERGELVTGPWMLAWKGWWGCLNSPEYRAVYLDYVKMYLDAGADSLQMDDPGENHTAVQWGGCYCRYCKEKAARLGKSPKDIQKESTEEFYRWIRAEMDAYAGRHVPFSCNSRPGDRYFFDEAFDFGLAELPEGKARPEFLYQAIRDAERRGKAQMFTFVSTHSPLTRAAIALAYACGSQIIVPWDVYIGTGLPRYFGKPEEYADLYGFARANARFLDEYEDAAVLIPGVSDPRHGQSPIAVRGSSQDLNLFVRAIPGNADAPVVIHCVDTAENPEPFRLGIHPAKFFGGRPMTIDLLVPAPYDRARHDRAEQAKDFGSLAVKTRLAAGYVTEFAVPPLTPWGTIVIAPDTAAPKGVWPPSILPEDDSLYSTTLRLTLASATPGAAVRFTVDGSEPGESSTPYSRPLALTTDTLVKARSFSNGMASGVTSVSFKQTRPMRTAGSPAGMGGLRLWLKASELLKSHRAGERVEHWPAQAGPAMAAEKVKLYDGQMASAPVLEENAIGRMPAVRFKSGTDLLVIRNFASEHLGGPFTVFTVTRSEDSTFGACGNAMNGNGGIPRLYLLRDAFTYNASSVRIGIAPDKPAILAFTHNGVDTIAAWLDGIRVGTGTGPDFAPVGRFGGGNFAIPFWSGNTYHGGAIAEVIAFDRNLGDTERESVEQYLSQEYGIRTVKMWE